LRAEGGKEGRERGVFSSVAKGRGKERYFVNGGGKKKRKIFVGRRVSLHDDRNKVRKGRKGGGKGRRFPIAFEHGTYFCQGGGNHDLCRRKGKNC